MLEYDHLGPKTGNVADLAIRRSETILERELAGCEVRCANCHRRRTRTTPRSVDPRASAQVTGSRLPQRPAGAQEAGDVRCPRCERLLAASAFAWRSRARGSLQPWCRQCHNALKRASYAAHRARELARAQARRASVVAANGTRLRDFLMAHPCVDCGERDPIVLEFDHLAHKRTNVTTLVWRGAAWPTIAEEIAKCEVRCANCHRIRTARSRGYDARKRGLAELLVEYGEPGGTRTPGPHVRSVVLYPLSYRLSLKGF